MSRTETNPEIIRLIEYYFHDNVMKKEKQLRLAAESDDGYIGIDLLLTFSKFATIKKDVQEIVIECSHSNCMVISEDSKRIRRLHSFRALKKQTGDSFLCSLTSYQYITARKLWRQEIFGFDKETSKVEVLRKRRIHHNVLYCIGIFTSAFSLLEAVIGEESYVCMHIKYTFIVHAQLKNVKYIDSESS